MREKKAYPTFQEMAEYMDGIVKFNIQAESYEKEEQIMKLNKNNKLNLSNKGVIFQSSLAYGKTVGSLDWYAKLASHDISNRIKKEESFETTTSKNIQTRQDGES